VTPKAELAATVILSERGVAESLSATAMAAPRPEGRDGGPVGLATEGIATRSEESRRWVWSNGVILRFAQDDKRAISGRPTNCCISPLLRSAECRQSAPRPDVGPLPLLLLHASIIGAAGAR